LFAVIAGLRTMNIKKFYNRIKKVNTNRLPYPTDFSKVICLSSRADDKPEWQLLPRSIEEKLLKVDWAVKDVLVGSVRSLEQLRYCMETNHYYAPKRYISEDDLPIKYIAIYEDGIGTKPGSRYVGEVLLSTIVKRGKIPVASHSRPDAPYYYFKVRQWSEMPRTITIRDTNRTPRMTNRFLLDNCGESYQLFNINSEAEYRLMMALNTVSGMLAEGIYATDRVTYKFDNSCSIKICDGIFTVIGSDGCIVAKLNAEQYAKSPGVMFGRIKEAIGRCRDLGNER